MPSNQQVTLYAAQIRSSIEHLPLAVTVSVANGLLVGFVMAQVVSTTVVVAWIAMLLVLSAFRATVFYTFRQTNIDAQRQHVLAALATSGTILAGVSWGCAPLLFTHLDEAHLMFLAFVIAGMCAGAATVHAAHLTSVVGFIVPAISPLAATFFTLGGHLRVIAGAMTVIYGIALCVASMRFANWFRATMEAQFSLTTRTQQLDETNERLHAEITSHRFTEAKFQQAQKLEAIGRLTAGIAHDFNNLLMAIGGSAGLIGMRLARESVQNPHLATIEQSVERGITLTRGLLAFGRQQTLAPRSVDVNHVVAGLRGLLVATLAGHGHFGLQLGRSEITAFVDVSQLEQAILNLIINARDAMLENGIVTIRTAAIDLLGNEKDTEGLIGRFALIAISDTGIGMSDDVRLRAFDPFFTTKAVGEGSGLGLSQVYGFVEQSGGTTRIQSEPGQGTTVSMYLPEGRKNELTSRQSHRWLPRKRSESPDSGHRIILVDDDDDVLHTLSAMLEGAGYGVTPYRSPLRALEEIGSSPSADLIVADFAMPELRGDEFVAKVRRLRSTIPIVFVTGYADPVALRSEPWVLQKPFRAASLIQTVERAIADRGQ
jgi:signal transduction histidine kinase/CheY-like chemotaxis protein